MSTTALRKAVAALGAVALIGLAACSSEASVQGATTTVAQGGDVTTTVAAPPVTDGVTTTVPATDAPPLTPPPLGPIGWATVDPADYDAPLAFPCCASNWFGISASPALPAAGAPLADGVYRIDFEMPTAAGQSVKATVSRFELCSNLPEGSCEDVGGFTDDDFGVDTSASFGLELAIDGSLWVVLGGFNGSGGNNFVLGNGADLTELVLALDADYQTAVLTPFAAGVAPDDIVAGLVANPAYGFAAPVEEFSGALSYTHGGAPPLLFQMLPGVNGDGGRGSDVIGRIALVVQGGTYLITTYAGFYS